VAVEFYPLPSPFRNALMSLVKFMPWSRVHVTLALVHTYIHCPLQQLLMTSLVDKGIASLARIVRKTEELSLIRLKQLTGEGFKGLVSRALRHLDLQESNGISEPGFMALVRNCPNIEKLCLTEVHKLSDVAFACIAEVLGGKLVSVGTSNCMCLIYYVRF
jgi:hypothetical protein